MFVQLMIFCFLFQYCLAIRNNSTGICHKINLCQKTNEFCHPVVMRCQNGSCHYRRFNTNNNRYLMVSRWFYDSLEQRCRRYNHHLENFVYFRYRRDCKRACPIIRQKRNDRIITLHVSESPPNYNDTVYVHLQVDLSPEWVKTLSDSMNISTQNYYSQTHYFQNYRRHFTNFMNPMQQLMLNRQHNVQKKYY